MQLRSESSNRALELFGHFGLRTALFGLLLAAARWQTGGRDVLPAALAQRVSMSAAQTAAQAARQTTAGK